MSRDGSRAKTSAIDHVIGNMQAPDKPVEPHVDYSLSLSDHYPVVVTLRKNPVVFQVQKTPSPPRDLERIQRVPLFPILRGGATFKRWQDL